MVKLKLNQTDRRILEGADPHSVRWLSKLNMVSVVVDFWSLLMGREFKPNSYAVLLVFGNKDEGDVKNGLEVAEKCTWANTKHQSNVRNQ